MLYLCEAHKLDVMAVDQVQILQLQLLEALLHRRLDILCAEVEVVPIPPGLGGHKYLIPRQAFQPQTQNLDP